MPTNHFSTSQIARGFHFHVNMAGPYAQTEHAQTNQQRPGSEALTQPLGNNESRARANACGLGGRAAGNETARLQGDVTSGHSSTPQASVSYAMPERRKASSRRSQRSEHSVLGLKE